MSRTGRGMIGPAMLPRSISYDVGTSSSALRQGSPLRFKRERREGRMEIPSESSDDEEPALRRLRSSLARRPSRKISVLSSVNPSPRVSMFEGPNISMLDTPEEEKKHADLELHKESAARVICTLLVIVTIVQLVIIIYLLTRASSTNYCSSISTDYHVPRDLKNPGIFDDLTPDELNSISNFMLQNKLLQLSTWTTATINSSYIYMIELFLPNKTNVLQYIDRGYTRPKREAKVTIFRGNVQPPRVEEYIVYPLPRPDTYRLYKDPSFRGEYIPFSSRPNDRVEIQAADPLIDSVMEKLYPLLMESYGLCYHNCTKNVNCMKVFDTAPRGLESGDRKTWIWFFPDIEDYYNHPLGLEILINHKSIDSSKWFVELLVYNGQSFSDTETLMEAYWLGRLKKINYHDHSEHINLLERQHTVPGLTANQPGPRHFEPGSKRFQISGQLISYNDWQFFYSMRPTTGLQIFNVLFAGSRIAYEISLQEVAVFYTGHGAAQGDSNFYDTSTMIGASSMELVRGIDCPDTASFLDSYFWVDSGEPKRTKNNICVFERNSDLPIHRHYANDYEGGYEYYKGTPTYSLVVRTIASIWNYDYIFDYIFYNNGAIEVKVSLTGYVQSTFKLSEEAKYGNAINDDTIANLHKHLFHYKIDLDIAGDLNRYTIENIELTNVSHPWFPNITKLQMEITKTLVSNESSNVTEDFKSEQYHLFHNKNAQNKYHSDRAYRIINKSPVNDLLSDKDVTAAASWSKYPIIVSRRKDSERRSSSIYAQNDPWNPVLDFDDYVDGESLIDEDLVAWVTMGTYHIPGTEDVPLTPTVWNQYSFFLAPHNYFWRSPDTDRTDSLKIKPRNKTDSSKNGSILYGSYNNMHESKCVPRASDLSDYDGRRS